jgi:hypothetical protein
MGFTWHMDMSHMITFKIKKNGSIIKKNKIEIKETEISTSRLFFEKFDPQTTPNMRSTPPNCLSLTLEKKFILIFLEVRRFLKFFFGTSQTPVSFSDRNPPQQFHICILRR